MIMGFLSLAQMTTIELMRHTHVSNHNEARTPRNLIPTIQYNTIPQFHGFSSRTLSSPFVTHPLASQTTSKGSHSSSLSRYTVRVCMYVCMYVFRGQVVRIQLPAKHGIPTCLLISVGIQLNWLSDKSWTCSNVHRCSVHLRFSLTSWICRMGLTVGPFVLQSRLFLSISYRVWSSVFFLLIIHWDTEWWVFLGTLRCVLSSHQVFIRWWFQMNK